MYKRKMSGNGTAHLKMCVCSFPSEQWTELRNRHFQSKILNIQRWGQKWCKRNEKNVNFVMI